jgi:glutamate-1-semialdehyde 2,1-aminomutase
MHFLTNILSTQGLLYLCAGSALAWLLWRSYRRLQLSRAKHPSLAGHARMSRRLAALVPFYEYDEARYFSVDDAPEHVATQRRAGFMRLSGVYAQRFVNTARLTSEVEATLCDLLLTANYRVPFQFNRLVRSHLKACVFVKSSSGVTVTDLDDNVQHDLSGSYGVNVLGYDFYKECMDRGADRVRALGPVLGTYHPLIAYNAQRLKEISGLDEVSFHMSGTEAVKLAALKRCSD